VYTGTKGRICKVCPLGAAQREAVELALGGKAQKDGKLLSAIAVARECEPPLSATDISYHKTHCMGVPPRHRTEWGDLPRQPIPDLGAALLRGESTALAVPLVWEPTAAREMGRSKLLLMAQRAEAQLKETPTAAFYSTWLEIIKEVIREAEKGGGDLADRAKNYLEMEVRQQREVKRKITMEEIVTTTTECEPAVSEAAVFSETGSV
jgi:hypothetical protein